ncbi:MAG TPA: alpha/beta family hydrolase [Acidobacteriaceae bacterium]|nr:alpha/beta family hydrolase [Acidobacteriaceae bacterium]
MSQNLSSSVVRNIEDLRGPAGRLEAILNLPEHDSSYAALVCHPHPLFGGTMHNKVVYHAMKAFLSHGIPVLRFNFRGAGLSEGTHDNGHGEVEDVRAGLAWMVRDYDRPLLFAGFSFGSSVGLRACCGDERVKGIAALGLPVSAGGREYHYRFLAGCHQPKLFISGTADQYGPRASVEAVVANATPPAELVMVEGADHFFMGKLELVQQALSAWIEAHFIPSAIHRNSLY